MEICCSDFFRCVIKDPYFRMFWFKRKSFCSLWILSMPSPGWQGWKWNSNVSRSLRNPSIVPSRSSDLESDHNTRILDDGNASSDYRSHQSDALREWESHTSERSTENFWSKAAPRRIAEQSLHKSDRRRAWKSIISGAGNELALWEWGSSSWTAIMNHENAILFWDLCPQHSWPWWLVVGAFPRRKCQSLVWFATIYSVFWAKPLHLDCPDQPILLVKTPHREGKSSYKFTKSVTKWGRTFPFQTLVLSHTIQSSLFSQNHSEKSQRRWHRHVDQDERRAKNPS
jgi:hypothetical protein